MTPTPMVGVMSAEDLKRFDTDIDAVNKRLDKNDPLDEPITDISEALVKQHVMQFGTDYPNGEKMAFFLINYTRVMIAILQEQGYLLKTMPKKKSKADTEHPGQYL